MRNFFVMSMITAGLTMLCSGCAEGPGYGGIVSGQVDQVRGYQFAPSFSDVSGPSTRQLSAAEHRSDIQADTAENFARAQHAELGVVDHRLDTARRAQYYDHQAHMDRNEEHRDDFWSVEHITGSISGTASNVNSTMNNINSIFK